MFVRAGALLAVAVTAAACAYQPPDAYVPAPDDGAVWCDGVAVLMIRNNTGQSLEVVEARQGSGSRVVVGYVGVGRSEINIRPITGYSYFTRARSDGSNQGGEYRRPGADVTMERQCRTGS